MLLNAFVSILFPYFQVPDRFYCPLCVEAGKDKACENPCMACGSNDRDDLILVCDRDQCYSYFHCYCLPQPLAEPPEVCRVDVDDVCRSRGDICVCMCCGCFFAGGEVSRCFQ